MNQTGSDDALDLIVALLQRNGESRGWAKRMLLRWVNGYDDTEELWQLWQFSKPIYRLRILGAIVRGDYDGRGFGTW